MYFVFWVDSNPFLQKRPLCILPAFYLVQYNPQCKYLGTLHECTSPGYRTHRHSLNIQAQRSFLLDISTWEQPHCRALGKMNSTQRWQKKKQSGNTERENNKKYRSWRFVFCLGFAFPKALHWGYSETETRKPPGYLGGSFGIDTILIRDCHHLDPTSAGNQWPTNFTMIWSKSFGVDFVTFWLYT